MSAGAVFDAMVGQAEALESLSAAVRQPAESMTHAWLLVGPPGSGRSVAAQAFAAALQCRYGGCGDCRSCRTVAAGTHADVHRIVPQGLSVSVQEMRAIVLTAARAPAGGRWQVVIVEDADRLTEAAGNALLKSVEEPSPRTVFLLCAPSDHPDDVPVTIRSRCRVVTLRTPSAAAVAELLVARDGIDQQTAIWAARAAAGHVGRARRLATDPDAAARRRAVISVPARLSSLAACLSAADELVTAAESEAAAVSGQVDAPERDALATAMGAGATGRGTAATARGSAAALKELEKRQKSRSTRTQRDALDRALVDLAGVYRDVLVRQAGADVPAIHPDLADEMSGLVRARPEEILARLDAVLACRTALGENVKPRIAVEALTAALRI